MSDANNQAVPAQGEAPAEQGGWIWDALFGIGMAYATTTVVNIWFSEQNRKLSDPNSMASSESANQFNPFQNLPPSLLNNDT